jgi:hypothetical protein
MEDVEVLLGGEKYVECPDCTTRNTAVGGRSVLNTDCNTCKAWSWVPNPRYVAAALRAGLPVPLTAEALGIKQLDQVWKKMKMNGVKVDLAHVDDLMKRTPK